jgi:PAS domain S-box-containing protein
MGMVKSVRDSRYSPPSNPPQDFVSFPLRAGIVGGGRVCEDLLRLLTGENYQTRPKIEILGVFDSKPDAPGILYAKEHAIFTTIELSDLFSLPGINLILELTGSTAMREDILKVLPKGIYFLDRYAARLLWELIRLEEEKILLERRLQKEEELEKKHTQTILDSLPYRIMVVNLDMTVDMVNQTFLKSFHFDPKDCRGKHCYELRYGLKEPCDGPYRVCYLKHKLDELKEKGLISEINEYLDDEGNPRFDVVTLAPILNEEGEITQLLEASRDVTDRVRLERKMEQSKIFLENVIASTVDGIVVVDNKGNVLIFNEGMEKLTGYSADEIIERGHLSTFYDIEMAKENMRKMRSDRFGPLGKLNPTSMNITTKQGQEIPVTLSASIIVIEGKEVGSAGVFRDMREILQMRKELEETHLQLVQSEKVASVGRMAAGVAHEINNPLSGVLIYSELLKTNFENDTQQYKDIQEIIDQTLRCKKIVSELLEFSRQTVGKISSFSLEELINKTLNLLIHQALFQDIEVTKSIQQGMPKMHGDVGQLQQVFTNLFTNAAHAMKGRGKLDITAQFKEEKNVFIIRVTDTGPGIPEELRDKIFEIFFTTKPVGQGTGLGLSISQNILKLHCGTLSVECPPEGGTCFVMEIPLGFAEQSIEEPVFIGLDE